MGNRQLPIERKRKDKSQGVIRTNHDVYFDFASSALD